MEGTKQEEKKIIKFEDLLTENGLRVSGLGLLVNKVDSLIQKQDRTNQLLSFIEKKVETLIANQNTNI